MTPQETCDAAMRDLEAACRTFRAASINVETILHNAGFHAASTDVANLRYKVETNGNRIVEKNFKG